MYFSIFQLSPKCRSMLRKCSWEGKDQACDDIFLLRKTQNGYCCTFNYARRNDGFGRCCSFACRLYSYNSYVIFRSPLTLFCRTSSAQNDVFASQHIERSTNIGPEYGLSVLLDPRLDDRFYKILPIDGFKVNGSSFNG